MDFTMRLALIAMLFFAAGCPKEADDVAAPAVNSAAPQAEPVAAPAAEIKPAESDKMANVSYAIGFFNGSGFREQSIEIVVDSFVQGMRDGLSGATPPSSEEQMRETLTLFGQELRTKMMERMRQEAAENKQIAEQWLKENATREGVKTTASGLQYKVLTEGTGAIPTAGDVIRAHYRGTFIDGEEFDSSFRHGEPVTLAVSGVIPGWTEALQLMKVGSKWQLFIHPDLAYGENAPPIIGPNRLLIFEVELLEIVQAEGNDPNAPSAPEAPAEN